MVTQSRLVWMSVGLALLGSVTFSSVFGARSAQAVPPDQVARGEAVFNAACAECHGPGSENLDAPLLLRNDSLRRFPNAAAAHRFISTEMPSETPGSLTPEEYWDVLAFLLTQSGISTGETALGPDNAATVPARGEGSRRTPGSGAPAGAPPAEAPPAEKPEVEPTP
jgi:mono/diheme cytochrome c family protein